MLLSEFDVLSCLSCLYFVADKILSKMGEG